jgi:O-antigen/teichoic acid export membrane protein
MVATPFVIRELGSRQYGALALLNTVFAYMTFTDFGLGIASTRLASKAYGSRDGQAEADAIWTCLVLTAVPSLTTCLLLAPLAPWLLSEILRVPVEIQKSATLALRILPLAIMGRNLCSILNTSQSIRLRMRSYTLITCGSSLLQICGLPVVIRLGGRLPAAAGVISAAWLAPAMLHFFWSIKLVPALRRFHFRRQFVRPAFFFGKDVTLLVIVTAVLTHSEKLLLTRFASVTSLAHYAVAFNLASLLMNGATALNQWLLPAFSRLATPENQPERQKLYTQALRMTLFWIPPAMIFLGIGARPLLRLWAGSEYADESALQLRILLFGFAAATVAFNAQTVLVAGGRSSTIARNYLFELVPYLIGAALLTRWLYSTGAAIAWSLRNLIDLLHIIATSRTQIAVPFSPFAGRSWHYAFSLSPFLLLGLWTNHFVSIFLFALSFAGATLLYFSFLWIAVFSKEERSWFSTEWNRLRSFMKRI